VKDIVDDKANSFGNERQVGRGGDSDDISVGHWIKLGTNPSWFSS
jgi:hypothetical protein